MAKTLRNVYGRLCSFENLWEAYRKARRGKRYGLPAAWFDRDAETRLLTLRDELLERRYRPGVYHNFVIREPKRRVVSAAPFRDRVVHHALVNVLEPFYEARFSSASYACRKGMGTHAAMERAHWGVRNVKYLLKGDLVKFFPSVDHAVMKGVLSKRVGDAGVLWLAETIIDSGRGILEGECPPMWFAGDDLLAPSARERGLPIGNLTSQFFANVLLDELDRFVEERVKPRHYVRYSDDCLLFDDDAGRLAEAKALITERLDGLRLKLHPTKTAVRASGQGVVFLGFRLLPQTRRIARNSISRFRRRVRRVRAATRADRRSVDFGRVMASVRGWVVHASNANTHALVREVLRGSVF